MPAKLTPELIASVVADIEKGVPRKDAARCAGIRGQELGRWISMGQEWEEDPEQAPPERRLHAELAQAVGDAESRFVRNVVLEMHGRFLKGRSTSSELELLGRLRPEEYGRRDKLEHGGGQTVEIKVVGRPPRDENYRPVLDDGGSVPLALPAVHAPVEPPHREH
jgi:hypothetical protein